MMADPDPAGTRPPNDDAATGRSGAGSGDPPRVDPRTLRALWQSGHLYAEQCPPLAVELLMGGADSPSLRELAGMDRPARAQLEPLMDRVLAELGAPRLDPGVAWRITARWIAARALRGTIAPYDAAHSLYTMCSDNDWPPELQAFLGLADEWEHPLMFAGRAEIEAEILEACGRLLVVIGDPVPAPGGGAGPGSRPGGA